MHYKKQELGLDSVFVLPLSAVHPSPENDQVYRPADPDDPSIIELASDLAENGVREPLAITQDNFIVSGHRCYAAATRAGLTDVPCRRVAIRRQGNANYVAELVAFNANQRVKTHDETLREEVVLANPEESHRLLTEHRQQAARITADTIELREHKERHRITTAKAPFLAAIQAVIASLEEFWPVSARQIHYGLLNGPPLIHARKPGSRYRNDLGSYKALVELLTRARYEGIIPFEVIHDPTRPVTTWQVHGNVGQFYRATMGGLLKGYYRNLQQSQPNHIEIVGEKNTIDGIIRPVAMEMCIPLTIGRGFCSTPPKRALVQRFRASGKQSLVVLIVSDHDPDGEEIAHSLARGLRDDFHVPEVRAVKVALTREQVDELELPAGMVKAKPTSTNYERFVRAYGDDVYELEAIPPAELQRLLRQSIDRVLDAAAFNAEINAEKRDAAHLDVVRRRLLSELNRAQGAVASGNEGATTR